MPEPCFEFHALGESPLGEVCSESHSAFVSAGRARLFVDEIRQRLHQMIRHRGVEATKHRWWFGLVGAGRVPCSAGPPPRERGLPPPPPPSPLRGGLLLARPRLARATPYDSRHDKGPSDLTDQMISRTDLDGLGPPFGRTFDTGNCEYACNAGYKLDGVAWPGSNVTTSLFTCTAQPDGNSTWIDKYPTCSGHQKAYWRLARHTSSCVSP
uniref:Uncharacterized protein n=1 Tax=Chromera velia CCMP2878 TaxID=1169474 RepID=A0A0G4G2U3_9ALVE|eukprot:Cvel_4101.t1-p1 / transcript=Cvel_4101.t1 / gene=Cvel_4101 / organism=Chromera_velia_CCMP2878 / gene_product=hypothetical protein / transcript_product=hypothetical protein / location=Cvel_scaffold174:116368-120536(+) / protein_length=210 / sequence_SO=supercontig / SO=protein_coding / is_pseudo=false